MDRTELNKNLFKSTVLEMPGAHGASGTLWLLDISGTEEELLGQMRKNTRYHVRRAEKDGVSIISGATQELMDLCDT